MSSATTRDDADAKSNGAVGMFIGAVVGLWIAKGGFLARVTWAALGAFVGHQIGTRVAAARPRSMAGSTPTSDRARALIRVAVAVARVTGAIEPAARQQLHRYFERDAGLPESRLGDIDRWIAEAVARPAETPADAARGLVTLDKNDRAHVVFVLFRIALADRQLLAVEEIALRQVASVLGIDGAEFDNLRDLFVVPHDPQGTDRDEDWRLLGVEPGADMDEVKARYRELVKTYHPDRYQHLGEEFVRIASEKFKAIHDAYQRIEASGATHRPPPRQKLVLCSSCRTFSPRARAECGRCGRPRFSDSGADVRLICPFCRQTNQLPRAALDGLARCGNCKVLLVR